MEAYLRKHWAPHASKDATVTCRFYQSEARNDRRRLQLTATGIELYDVRDEAKAKSKEPQQPTEVIPWSAVLGASESIASTRRRFVPGYAGHEEEEERELLVFGCLPKQQTLQRPGVVDGLLSLASTVATSLLPMSRGSDEGDNNKQDKCERVLVQWVFGCEGDRPDVLASRLVNAIQYLADPRTQQLDSGKENTTDEATKSSTPRLRPRSFLVVINPAGGAGNAQRTYEHDVAPVLEQAHVEVETVLTTHAGHATEIMAAVPVDNFDCIVAVGGDGLLSEMVQGLMGRKDWEKAIRQPLGVVPGGSGNGLSAALLTRAGERLDPINAAYALAKGWTQELDLFSATNGQDKVMYGFLSLEWAFIANMDIASEKFRAFGDLRFVIATAWQIFGLGRKNFPGKLRYLVSEENELAPEKYHDRLEEAKTARPVCSCLDSDNGDAETKVGKWEELDGPFYMFWGMNVSHAASDAHIAPPAAISDGYFHLMLVSGEDFSRVELARLMMGIEHGAHLDLDRVQLLRTRAFKLRASEDDDLICVDGELFPGPEIQVEVHRALGRVICLPALE